MRRTHTCGELREGQVGTEVTLMGWVQRRRDHGGVIFIDFRDKSGITQIVFNPEINPGVHDKAQVIRNEYVLGVRGRVVPRPDDMLNPNMVTGAIEVLVDELKILNQAETPAFQIEIDFAGEPESSASDKRLLRQSHCLMVNALGLGLPLSK